MEARPIVLVIDDEPDNLRVVVHHLEAYSFEILTALDGHTGLQRARLARPDVILLDVNLPDLQGFEVCRRLKADPDLSAVPVLFLTALTDTQDKIRGFEAGGVDYVTKPIEAAELLARVRTHLENAGLRARLEQRVAQRTAALQQELREKDAYQQEREKLLDMVRWQSEQLRILTRHWVEGQKQSRQGLATELETGVSERLRLVQLHLEQARRLGTAEPFALPALLEHLGTAQEILGPALDENRSIAGRLGGQGPDDAMGKDPLVQLSTREYEVLQLMAAGLQNKQIANVVVVARTTVGTYRVRLLEKLGVSDTASLLKLAFRHKVPRWKEP
jgi:DNA-binding response OmpR family regulator/DNA-binding CsgD family transcriptional regulator